jgi:hypothetical protein
MDSVNTTSPITSYIHTDYLTTFQDFGTKYKWNTQSHGNLPKNSS